MESTIYWDVTPCSLIKVYWRFRATYYNHLQGRKLRQASNQHADLYLTTRHHIAGRFTPWFGSSTFRRIYDLHYPGRKVCQATNGLLVTVSDWITHRSRRRYFPPKRRSLWTAWLYNPEDQTLQYSSRVFCPQRVTHGIPRLRREESL
jgi:hypothetical protein